MSKGGSLSSPGFVPAGRQAGKYEVYILTSTSVMSRPETLAVMLWRHPDKSDIHL